MTNDEPYALQLARELFAGREAWVVGGAVRDQRLGRPLVDIDIACREPERAARAYARRSGGAPFALSERHGASSVALADERTVDFTPLPNGIEADLSTRDFTIKAVAVPLEGGEPVDPTGGLTDLELRTLRAVTEEIFRSDPLRLLRAVRLEDELGFRIAPMTANLVRRDAGLVVRPAGERVLAELRRLSIAGYRRLEELGLLEHLGGSLDRLERLESQPGSPDFLLVAVFEEVLDRFPISNELRRYKRALLSAERPPDSSARAVHRFRRATEPWALDALAFLGAQDLVRAVEQSRAAEPQQPLLRGDELGLPPSPDVGHILEAIEEERAVGTIRTREEALEFARGYARSLRENR